MTKKTASALKKRNKKAAEGQRSLDTLWSKPGDAEAQTVTRAVAELDAASDASVEALTKKEARWDGILGSREYLHQKFVADAWCAAFFWPKQAGEMADTAPTNELWRQLRDAQGQTPSLTAKTVHALAEQLRFFHWHLQFPQVVAKGGFDVVLGNPPWVRQELLKREKRLLTQFSSYASTADSSVYFIERGIQVGSSSGFVAMLTPNKWFRAAYAESLRALNILEADFRINHIDVLDAQCSIHAGRGLAPHMAGDTNIGVVCDPIAIGILAAQADGLHAWEGDRCNLVALRPVGFIMAGGALEAVAGVTGTHAGDGCRTGRRNHRGTAVLEESRQAP